MAAYDDAIASGRQRYLDESRKLVEASGQLDGISWQQICAYEKHSGRYPTPYKIESSLTSIPPEGNLSRITLTLDGGLWATMGHMALIGDALEDKGIGFSLKCSQGWVFAFSRLDNINLGFLPQDESSASSVVADHARRFPYAMSRTLVSPCLGGKYPSAGVALAPAPNETQLDLGEAYFKEELSNSWAIHPSPGMILAAHILHEAGVKPPLYS
jgi:hypothetical protein